MTTNVKFPSSFIWGAAAASYQIEGSTEGVDGCAGSVWDMYCRRPGKVKDGANGRTACDHYRRYREDVALMKAIGLQAYRFSIMWPRVLPDGLTAINQPGLDFYDRLVDELLAAGITPWATLFHWDYPLALFYRGGWLNEESPLWFERYVRVVVDRLSDRVRHWFTLNEPACFIGFGHQTGYQAPGLKLPDREVARAWHHALLAHGRAVRVIRQASRSPAPKVGFAPVFRTSIPDTGQPADVEAARQWMFAEEKNGFDTRWNLDPCFRKSYPAAGLALWGADAPPVKAGDLDLIGQELDFLGLNIYGSTRIKAGPDGRPVVVEFPADGPRNSLGWPITPEALRWATKFLYEEYRKPLLITENGVTLPDVRDEHGQVRDPDRIRFLQGYLGGLQQSVQEGIPVLGYFHWSIMDNFEWSEGYGPRFGLIHVDYQTQQRTLKESACWYRDWIADQRRPAP